MSGARRGYGRWDYGWDDARAELGQGIHPEVVAARLGEPVSYLLEKADEQRWPITYQGVTVDQILTAHSMWIDA